MKKPFGKPISFPAHKLVEEGGFFMFYIPSNGVKIAVYDHHPHACRTIVLVHGWPLSHKIYEYQIEPLVCRGFRVVLLDLRGFGASDAPACGYSYDQMAADLYQVVRTMGLRSFVLAGFSMGGAVALRYMRRFRGYGVCRLLLLAAAAPCWTQRPGFPYGLPRSYVDGLIDLAATDRPQLAENFSHQLFASPQSRAAIAWFGEIALSASGAGTVQAAISLRDEDGRADLNAVHVPTTLIHGAKDRIVSNDLVELQQRGIPGSALITLENSGHGILYDELARFNDVFLRAAEGR